MIHLPSWVTILTFKKIFFMLSYLMKKIIIGATGAIGSSIAKNLLAMDQKFILLQETKLKLKH